jgi:hypothetical protein
MKKPPLTPTKRGGGWGSTAANNGGGKRLGMAAAGWTAQAELVAAMNCRQSSALA